MPETHANAALHFARALTPQGWRENVRVKIAGARICEVESGVAPSAQDERHALGLPAIANLHSHAFQRAMAGLAETRGATSDSFWTWRETMYRFALRMTPDDVEAVAAQLYVEMLQAGFGAVAEFHYLHNSNDGSPYGAPAEMAGRIVAAARETGVGLTLAPVFYAHANFGGAPPLPEQRRFVNDLDGFARLIEDSRKLASGRDGDVVAIAPHSLRAATPDELSRLIATAGAAPIHIHIAEQVREVEDCLAWSGARPVRWLLDHAAVDRRWCLVHATHMDQGESSDLARSGAVAGLCPITEANLGDGAFNAPDYLAAGGRYGVGSDSNVEIGVAAELRQLEYSQRLAQRARNVCAPPGGSCGRALFDAAAQGGAQALGRDCGRLAVGAMADILTLRADWLGFAGREDDQILDAWIFSGGNALVDCVWSGGRRLVSDGRHHNAESIGQKFAAVISKLGEV